MANRLHKTTTIKGQRHRSMDKETPAREKERMLEGSPLLQISLNSICSQWTKFSKSKIRPFKVITSFLANLVGLQAML